VLGEAQRGQFGAASTLDFHFFSFGDGLGGH